MGKKTQKKYDDMMNQLQGWITRASTPSPYETELAADRSRIRGFLDSKDYRNLPTGVNVDLLPLADYQRMSKMQNGSGDNVAKGALTADAMANRKELSNNQLVRDWGGAYEQKVSGLMDQQAGMGDALQNQYTNRMSMGMQGTQNQLQNIINRPKSTNWFQQIMGMVGPALPGIISAI